MEMFDVKYKGQTVRVILKNKDNIYIKLPKIDNGKNSEFTESITKEPRGWRFSSFKNEDLEYMFHIWLRDDNSIAWANDLSAPKIYESTIPFNREKPNYELLNKSIIPLYDTVQEVKSYLGKNIPAEDLYSLRKHYLTTTLKMLGYDSIDAIGENVNDSPIYLPLNRVAEQLENYCNLTSLVHSEGKDNDEDLIMTTIPENMNREAVLKIAKPVYEQATSNVEFMRKQDYSLSTKRKIISDYKVMMSSKLSPEDWETYSKTIKSTALLLLKLNADLLTPEQREKFEIPAMTLLDDISTKDRISKLIDSEEFNAACRIENEFGYNQSNNMAIKLAELKDENPGSIIDVESILEEELSEANTRKISIENNKKLNSKYFGKRDINSTKHDFDDNDEYEY